MYLRSGKKIKSVILNREYSEYLSKFRGSLLFRGKSSLSFKLLDRIQFLLKETFGIESDYLFKRVMKNLMPFIGQRKLKLGKKTHTIPMPLQKHRRFILLNQWLIKIYKGKSNTRGLNIKDIYDGFYEILYEKDGKGTVLELKQKYLEASLASRYLLSKQLRTSRRNKWYVRKLLNRIKFKKKRANLHLYNARLKFLLRSLRFIKRKKSKRFRRFFRKFLKRIYLSNKFSKNQKFLLLVNYIIRKRFFFSNYFRRSMLKKKFFVNYVKVGRLKRENEKKKIINKI